MEIGGKRIYFKYVTENSAESCCIRKRGRLTKSAHKEEKDKSEFMEVK